MNLRQAARAAWRWPLYSRLRAIGTLAAVLAIILIAPRLLHPSHALPAAADSATSIVTASPEEGAPPPPDDNPASSNDPQQPTPTTLTTVAQGSSEAEPPATAGPAPTNPTPSVDTVSTAATHWLQTWCTTDPTQAADDNIRAVRNLMTAAAYTAELQAGVTAESWARTQRAGLSTLCQGIRVETPSAAPRSLTSQWVVLTAQQVTLDRSGALISSQAITQTRLVIQDPTTGHWLIDQEVQAG